MPLTTNHLDIITKENLCYLSLKDYALSNSVIFTIWTY